MKLPLAILFAAAPTFANADTPEVIAVSASLSADSWRFDVTVRHNDEGWGHYADGWGVYDENGRELGYRALLHPHVNEQPFTRSLTAVIIPTSVKSVVIRAHDSIHGDSKDFAVDLDWGNRD